MSHQQASPRRRVLATVAIVAAAALAIAWMVGPRLKPLTALEQRLVGQWTRPDVTSPQTHTFAANRRYAADDQFTGVWSVSDGQLHIRFWSKNQPRWYRRLAPEKDETSIPINFDDSSDRVELYSPSDAEHMFLERKTEP